MILALRHRKLVLVGMLTMIWLCLSQPAFGNKGVSPFYEDPFDIAAGGASLTRASKDGRLYSNPALLPLGKRFHRWLGFNVSLLYNSSAKDSALAALKFSQTQEDREGEAGTMIGDIIDKAYKEPIYVGANLSLSWVTNSFGLSVFSRSDVGAVAREAGPYGSPELSVMLDSYGGGIVGAPLETPVPWLILGVAAKYLGALSAEQQILSAAITSEKQELNLTPYTGMGFDAGALLFFQGNFVDLTVALKMDDIGNTTLTSTKKSEESDAASGEAPPNRKVFKESMSTGLGLTLHNEVDAIHLAIDYRDLQGAYEERLYKKVYAGAKVILRGHLGLATGLYHGHPSFGAEIDLIVLRLAMTQYTRELGDYPGDVRLKTTMMTISAGF